VDLKGRTREMALARAKDVYGRAAAGKEDFLQLAARYSDDPSKNKNGGDLGYNSPKSFVDPVREAIDKMKKGEIVGPIESDYGFHIIKLIDRKEPERIPFERVKRSLIKAEREKIEQKRVDDAVQAIRNSPTVVTNRENVEKLVVKIDPAVIERALKGEAQIASPAVAK
jgi:parvulin-like peptidyl-prolyl isomerase